MSEKQITIKKTLDTNQIAAFLRLLASELEGTGGPATDEFGNQLHDFNKLKIGLIKQEGGQLSLSLKVKNRKQEGTVAPTEFADIAERDYRPFKQRLKSTFSDLTACANQGVLPSSELLSRFMAESKQLISFPGFGDPYYDDYWQACRAMEQAVKSESASTFQEKWAAVTTIKKACHRRFK